MGARRDSIARNGSPILRRRGPGARHRRHRHRHRHRHRGPRIAPSPRAGGRLSRHLRHFRHPTFRHLHVSYPGLGPSCYLRHPTRHFRHGSRCHPHCPTRRRGPLPVWGSRRRAPERVDVIPSDAGAENQMCLP